MVRIARTLVSTAGVIASANAQATGAWNDTLCHNPTEPNCNPCYITVGNVTEVLRWSGGDMFPAVKPWYNSQGSADGPTGNPCSACMDRYLDNFRQMLASKPPGCNCATGGPFPDIPCNAPAPGLYTCDCYCAYETKLPALCNIDTSVVNFPGPCAVVRARYQLQNKPFPYTCDYDGYYNLKQTGPSPTGSAPGQFTWCTDPTTGQNNLTTVVPASQGSTLNCGPTVQCELMNTFRCQRPEFHNLCWWLQDVGPWHGHQCVSKSSPSETEGEATDRVVAEFLAANRTSV